MMPMPYGPMPNMNMMQQQGQLPPFLQALLAQRMGAMAPMQPGMQPMGMMQGQQPPFGAMGGINPMVSRSAAYSLF